MKQCLLGFALLTLAVTLPAQAANYVIDTANQHAFIQFKISHLGYSFVLGRFDRWSGHFSYDEKNPDAAKVAVEIDAASIDTNSALRDKHLRSAKFFDTDKYPKIRFVSTSFKELAGGKALLKGNLTLHGVTRPVTVNVTEVGHGPDPWGGYRRGFTGTTTLTLREFNIDYNLGPTARTAELFLSLEGVRK